MSEFENFAEFYRQVTQFDDLLGMWFELNGPGDVTYMLEVKRHHLGAPDAAHGGVISAMMDSALGLTALSYAVSKGNFCSTVEFKLNFLSPARLGETLVGSGEIDFAGSKLITVSGKICDRETGRLVAKGLGTFSQYPISKKGGDPNMFGSGNASDGYSSS